MPSLIGILPESMPHDRIKVIDKSTYVEATPVVELTDPVALFAFVSPKGMGEDNKIVTIDGSNVGDYGTPNFAKWGVSLYNVNNYISGGGTVLGVRLMPADATHANIVVLAKHKILVDEPLLNDSGQALYKDSQGLVTTIATGNSPIVRDVLKVKLSTVSLAGANAQSPAAITTAMNALAADVVDAEGWKISPLFAIHSRAKGTFTNTYSFRISVDPTMEGEEPQQRFYRITGIDTTTGAQLFEPQVFTFNSDFMFQSQSMFLADVIDTYNKPLGVVISTGLATFKSIISTNGIDASVGEDSADDIDFIYGLTKASTKHFNYVLDTTSVSLSSSTGLVLAGGTDGAFAQTSPTRVAGISAAMVGVYNGTLTDAIYDELRYPFTHVFDNDDDPTVKSAVAALVEKRYTSCAPLCAPPTIKTYTEMDALRASVLKFNSFKTFIYTESALIADPYTGKRVRMPASYFNSYAFAAHYKNGGYAKPYAGAGFKWSGFIANSMMPQTTSVDVYKKQHLSRVNQMSEDGTGFAESYQQITSQLTMSKLSEINNVHILLRMVRICLRKARDSRWSTLLDSDIPDFQSSLKAAIEADMRGTYDSVEITTKREAQNGAGRNRILAVLNLTFKDVLKGVSYEFYIL
jgi:hypothetical protein